MLSHINREKIALKNPFQAYSDNNFFRVYLDVCFSSLDAFYHIETNQSRTIDHSLHVICMFIHPSTFYRSKGSGTFQSAFSF